MQPCRVCQHEQREQIDRLLLDGHSLRRIGVQWGLTKDSLARHWNNQHASHDRPALYWLDIADVCPDGKTRPDGKAPLLLRTSEEGGQTVEAKKIGGVLILPYPFPWPLLVRDGELRARLLGLRPSLTCPTCESETPRVYLKNISNTRKLRWRRYCAACKDVQAVEQAPGRESVPPEPAPAVASAPLPALVNWW